MPKVVRVTPAQVNAAKLKLKRSAASGRHVATSVSRIANAKRVTSVHRTKPGASGHESKRG